MSKFKNNIFSRSALDLDDAAQKAVKALKWWFKYKRIWLLFFVDYPSHYLWNKQYHPLHLHYNNTCNTAPTIFIFHF